GRDTTVVAITGSNGKTTVKTLVHSILGRTAVARRTRSYTHPEPPVGARPTRDRDHASRVGARPTRDRDTAPEHSAYANPGNRNNEIGLPLAVIEQPETAPFAIYEMGAGQPGDIAYLTDVVAPDAALVNNVAAAHLERMGSLLGVAET